MPGLYTALQRTFAQAWAEERSRDSHKPPLELEPTPNVMIPMSLFFQFAALNDGQSNRRVTEADRHTLHRLADEMLSSIAPATDGYVPQPSLERAVKRAILHRAIDALVL